MSIQTIRVVFVGTFPSSSSGSFLSANIARVDPSGNDSTGAVGNLGTPFLTVQAAIDAIEAGSFDHPIIAIGGQDYDENLTSSLGYIKFITAGTQDIFSSLTLTKPTGSVSVYIQGGIVSGGGVTGSTSGTLTVNINNIEFTGPIINTGSLDVNGNEDVIFLGTITSSGGQAVSVRGLSNYGNSLVIDSAGSDVTLYSSVLVDIEAAGSINYVDSRLNGLNSSGVTPTQSDIFLNQLGMDFSTLPQQTDDSGLIAGQGWIDTTGGNNIVKVKL